MKPFPPITTLLLHQVTRLNRITRLKKHVEFFSKESLDAVEISSLISIDDSININENTIIKTIEVSFFAGGVQKLAEFHVAFSFTVQHLRRYIQPAEDNKSGISIELNTWLNNIVIATTRGIIYTDLQGTLLDELILPLINPDDLRHSG